MNFKYNRQERYFKLLSAVSIKGIQTEVSIDTSYKESEFEFKIHEAIKKIENGWDSINKSLLTNLYDLHIESWRYEKEKDFSPEDFLSNLRINSVFITKGDSLTIRYTTGELFEGKILEVVYDKEGNVFVTGLME
jgi:hypothetical protein